MCQQATEQPKPLPSLLWSRPSSDTGYRGLALAGRLPHWREGKERYSHLHTLFGSSPWRRNSKFSPYRRRTWDGLWSVNHNSVGKLWCFCVDKCISSPVYLPTYLSIYKYYTQVCTRATWSVPHMSAEVAQKGQLYSVCACVCFCFVLWYRVLISESQFALKWQTLGHV